MRAAWIAIGLISAGSAARADDKIDVRIDAMNSPRGTKIEAKEITATASTTLCEKKPKLCHGPEQMLDGDLGTAWCEGLSGDGEGAKLTFTFAHPQPLVGIGIVPHFARSFSLAEANGALQTIDIATDKLTFTAEFDDLVADVRSRNDVKPRTGLCGDEGCLSRDRRIQLGVSEYISFGKKPKDPTDFFQEVPIQTTKVVMTLKAAYPGTKFNDTCASEITFYRAK